MNEHFKIGFTIFMVLGDLCRIMLIGKPRQPLTPTDAAIGLAITCTVLVLMWRT